MSVIPPNKTWKDQHGKLVRSSFKKGFINAVHINSRTVDVYYASNPQTIVKNIPVSNSIDITTVMLQQKCRIDIFDETNPNDCVCAYTF